MSTTLDLISEAWALIEAPEHWTQCATARDRGGSRVCSDSPQAVRWCAVGAVLRTFPDWTTGYAAVNDAAKQLYGQTTAEVNDEIGHAAVQRMYALAVALVADEEGLP